MSFLRRGAGKDVLLLHGYGSKKESFYYQINFLEKNYTVTAVDFPAFGASEAPDGAWGVGDYAEWLKKFILAAGLDKPHIIAHSFGARVAIKLLAQNPNLCEKLIITGGAGLVKPRSPQYIRRVKRYRMIKKIFPRYAEKHFGSEEYKKLSPVMKESYKKIVNEDLKEFAAKISNKTLLVYGREDTVTPAAEEGETFARLIKDSKLIITDGGHFAFSEYPNTFNTIISQFLSE
ncbi:MAG: alpha/beta hydrolase [Clostridia bacterium]|nr:alpha/beta hydrolase [Clostridia bacterium]